MSKNNLLATVDLGSNSFRLLIATIDENFILKPLDQIKETVRLAAGLDQYNNLNSEAQQIALATLARFHERLLGFADNQVRVVATSAFRIARNADEFIEKANKVLGFKIEIISGIEEARLIYIGAMHSLSLRNKKTLLIDIGGGSTEFVVGTNFSPIIMESVTIGCVSTSLKNFTNGVLNQANFDNAILSSRGKIQAMEHLFANQDFDIAVGTSGTAEALYTLCLEYKLSDEITLLSLYQIKNILIEYKNINNLILSGMKQDRASVIAGGLSIMIAIFEELKIDRMIIASGALREGVMYDLLGRYSDNDLRLNTVLGLQKQYVIDIEQGHRLANTSTLIYQSLNNQHASSLHESNELKLLHWAAQLYEIGLSISHNDYHKHGAYILANSDMVGFSKPEQALLANLVRSHRGSVLKILSYLEKKNIIKPDILHMIIAIRLSAIFHRNRKDIDNLTIKIINIDAFNFNLLIWLTTL